MPTSADYTDAVTDYHTALNLVRQADAEFLSLPAPLRAEFDNDPGRLVAFLEDEKNRPRAVELGLVKAPPGPPEALLVKIQAEEPAA